MTDVAHKMLPLLLIFSFCATYDLHQGTDRVVSRLPYEDSWRIAGGAQWMKKAFLFQLNVIAVTA